VSNLQNKIKSIKFQTIFFRTENHKIPTGFFVVGFYELSIILSEPKKFNVIVFVNGEHIRFLLGKDKLNGLKMLSKLSGFLINGFFDNYDFDIYNEIERPDNSLTPPKDVIDRHRERHYYRYDLFSKVDKYGEWKK
jgi:hypothetical protein